MAESLINLSKQTLIITKDISVFDVLLRLLTVVFLSSIIGFERASKRHSAGLRTFILVSFSSCMTMILDLLLMKNANLHFPVLSAFALFSVATVSCRTILYSSRNQIKGLTTAVALWSCALIGLSAGAGLYFICIIEFMMLLGILSYLPGLEQYLKNRSNHFEIHLELKNRQYLRDFVTTIRRLGLRIDDIERNSAYHGAGLSVYSVTFTIDSKELKKYKTHSEIIEALSTIDYICHIEEMR